MLGNNSVSSSSRGSYSYSSCSATNTLTANRKVVVVGQTGSLTLLDHNHPQIVTLQTITAVNNDLFESN